MKPINCILYTFDHDWIIDSFHISIRSAKLKIKYLKQKGFKIFRISR